MDHQSQTIKALVNKTFPTILCLEIGEFELQQSITLLF